MEQVAGSIGAAPIWRALMEKFLQASEVEQFDQPEDVVSEYICKSAGLKIKKATSSAILEYFVRGTEPVQYC